MRCHGIGSFNLRRRPLSVGKAIGASVFLFLDLSYRKNAEIQFAGRLHQGAIGNDSVLA
jgi:hypothetical protein